MLLPLWASYIARVYAWIVILRKGGTLSWAFQKIGVGPVNVGYTNIAMWLAFGVHRFRFFGREAGSLLLVLPLALPGIITGIALNSAFNFTAGAQNTLPLWVFGAIRLGQNLPEVNVVVVLLLTVVPVIIAARLTGGGITRGSAGPSAR